MTGFRQWVGGLEGRVGELGKVRQGRPRVGERGALDAGVEAFVSYLAW